MISGNIFQVLREQSEQPDTTTRLKKTPLYESYGVIRISGRNMGYF